MISLAPLDAFLSDYTFVVPSGEGVFRDQPNNIVRLPIDNHYVSLVVPAATAASLVLDGVPVDTSSFELIGTTDYLAGSVQLMPGTHSMAANEQFGLTVYGFGQEESYGHYAGLIFPDGSTSLDVIAQGPAVPLVAGSEEACIDIEIRDLGGALVPRARYQLEIVGTVPRNFTGFVDQLGVAQFCYTQAVPGTDTVNVSVAGDSALVAVEWLPNTDPGTNGAPAIVSLPVLILYDPTFVYPVATVDPDGDLVTVTVTNGPAGMSWSPATGELTWTPPIPADRLPTLHSIELTASDPLGANSTQQFELMVR